MYDVEKRLTKALSKIARALPSHLVPRMSSPRAGIPEESKPAMEELERSILDAALIAGAEKAEKSDSRVSHAALMNADSDGAEQETSPGRAAARVARNKKR